MTSPPGSVVCHKCRLEYPGDALFCPNCGTARHRDESGDPMVGTTVAERYQLLDRIGAGASGTIYRAEHVTLRRKVAVKVLHHELSRDDLAIERFRREATTVGQIENEHIVEILDFGRTGDGRLYLAMEFLEGETLSETMKREGQLPVDRAVDVLEQLGEALMEAHAMGYVHRDLRPRNIFLAQRRGRGGRPFVKLLDFGLAKLVEKEGEAASTSLGMTFGDPHYMSPEQARGDSIDRRADIYSMGCIAYQMLSGEPPFSGGKVFDVLTRHVDAQPVPLMERRTDVPPWLGSAVMRMLSKRPEERFITVYRLIEALKQGVGSGEIMSDEVALRQETVPPPSVSQAMAKLGARSANDLPVEDGAAAAAAPPAPEPAAAAAVAAPAQPRPGAVAAAVAAVPALSKLAGPAKAATAGGKSPAAPAAAAPFGGRTALGAGSFGAAGPAAAPTGKRGKRDSIPEAELSGSGGLSAAWFADGEALETGEDVLDTGARRKLERARSGGPSETALLAQEEFARESRRRWGFVVAIVGGLVLVAGAAFALWPSGDDDAEAGTRSVDAGEVAAAPAPKVAPTPAPAPTPTPTGTPPPSPTPIPTPTTIPTPEAVPTPTPTPSSTASAGASKSGSGKSGSGKSGSGTSGSKPGRFDHIGVDEPDAPVEKPPEPAETPHPQGEPSADAGKADFFAKLGERDLANNDFLSAATNFNKARELDPNNVAAIIGLGEIALGQGASGAAIAHLKKATKLRPGDARAHTLLGEAYLAAGQNGNAAASFKRALKLDPDNARARDGYNEAAGTEEPPPEPDPGVD